MTRLGKGCPHRMYIRVVGFFNSSLCAGRGSGQSCAATVRYLWWVWPILLYIVTFVMGIAAVLGGVGGGVLFVPIISGFFPFHLDFVRGAGLLVALAGALAAGPGLLKMNLASLRLAMPVALDSVHILDYRRYDRFGPADQGGPDSTRRHNPGDLRPYVDRKEVRVPGSG